MIRFVIACGIVIVLLVVLVDTLSAPSCPTCGASVQDVYEPEGSAYMLLRCRRCDDATWVKRPAADTYPTRR